MTSTSRTSTYFKHCAAHDFHLQQCDDCKLLRYPPTTACPWCTCLTSTWTPVEGKGEVHSYEEVHHAIQPAFKAHTPYLVLLVDLDTQKGQPTRDEALRVVGNLTTPDGKLAPPDVVKRVGIGSRVRMVFTDVADGSVAAAMDAGRRRRRSRRSRGGIRRNSIEIIRDVPRPSGRGRSRSPGLSPGARVTVAPSYPPAS